MGAPSATATVEHAANMSWNTFDNVCKKSLTRNGIDNNNPVVLMFYHQVLALTALTQHNVMEDLKYIYAWRGEVFVAADGTQKAYF